MKNRSITLWVKENSFKRFDIMAHGLVVLVTGTEGKIKYKVIGDKYYD